MTTSLPVDQIRIDGDTQNRSSVNDDTVADYVEVWKNDPPPFPPIDVFHDGSDYWCADGFHRLLAAIKAKHVIISCNIHKGGARDAFLFGCHANAKHGLRRSNADKRFATERLLADDEWGKLPMTKIAELARVTRRYVHQCKLLLTPHNGVNSSHPNGGAGKKPKGRGKAAPESVTDDSEPCANCGGIKWVKSDGDEFDTCQNCNHPFGEPSGDVEEQRWKAERSRLCKTLEAAMRSADDLYELVQYADRDGVIEAIKTILVRARNVGK